MRGTLSGLIAILMWSFLAVLVVYSGTTSPLLLTAITLLIGAFVLFSFNGYEKRDFSLLKKIKFFDYLFVFSGIFFYTVFIYVSFKITNPVEANTLNYLWPIFLGVFSSFRARFKLSFYEFFGLFVSFLGVVFLFYGKEDGAFFDNIGIGHIFAFLAALVWALYSTFAQERQYPQIIMIPVFIVSALFSLLIEFMFFETVFPIGIEWLAVFILGVFRISYAFWDYGMKKGNILFLSSLAYAIPLLSFFLLYLFGIIADSNYIVLSVFLVTLGCFLTNFKKIKKLLLK
jgi:drug/metabolite transporter (DMT)-like permease